ncbi:MAG: acyl-CoA thioesterase/bile acid-CoA:amino acid N-acyltransferase family protein [Bacteroidota bacterium]
MLSPMKFSYLLPLAILSCIYAQAQHQPAILTVHQESDLYHTPVQIRVSQLPSLEKIQFTLEAKDAKGHTWQSEAYYITNSNGQVDLAEAPSVGGSYLGIHPMGLFWSMKSKDYHQIATNKGFNATVSVKLKGKTIATQSFYRRSTRELEALGIQKIEKRDSIFANCYFPKSAQRLPAIIFIGGSGGNFREERTSLYASEGFVTLDLKYFRGEGLPDGIIDIPLEYVHRAHQWLMQQPQVDPTRIGVAGRSRGSELTLLYATKYNVSFAIAQVPSNVVWFGWADNKSSWTYQGQPYAYAEYTDEESEQIELEMQAKGIQYHDGPKFLSAFKNEALIEKAAIAVEEIQCPLLLISGKDDKVWPSTMMANRIVDRLIREDFQHEFLHLAYEDAGHNFAGGGQGCGIPFLPAEDYSNSTARGGTDRGNALAAADSWKQLLRFLYRHVGG